MIYMYILYFHKLKKKIFLCNNFHKITTSEEINKGVRYIFHDENTVSKSIAI